jgi:hypothetical protein
MTGRILVACEFSGTVRRAFAARGYDAWSCDLLPSEDRSNKHIVGDAREILSDGWDMLVVAHPPCTRLCNSGVRWLSTPPPGKTLAQNPVMHRHAKALIRNYQDPAQSVQPWQFGHGEVKRTCFWLRGLPKLEPTNIVEGRTPRVHHMPPGPDRWKERSRFFPGIASAMADQWGSLLEHEMAAA